MKVLIIGGGGREHALAWSLRKSKSVNEVVCAPGNGGIAAIARCVPCTVTDLDDMLRVAEREKPGLIVIGPEVPLALGVVDALQAKGMRVFGPTAAAAKLESSKAFAKDFMRQNDIPTADYAMCATMDEVRRELTQIGVPCVVKADGLAAGKGVVICNSLSEAEAAAEEMFSGALLGQAETSVVIEAFLEGEEVSFFALCDGKTAIPLAVAQDHKRIGEGDTGPNTGGMGAYSTGSLVSPAMPAWLNENVAQATVNGMAAAGTPFTGILFCGMMMTMQYGETIPMVLEFNTRFGDPETQAILMRLGTDLPALLEAAVDGRLATTHGGFLGLGQTTNTLQVATRRGASVCVILASGGYPGKYTSGLPISGLDASLEDGVEIFHSGTTFADGVYRTAGGRVLGITAYSENGLQDALRKAYLAAGNISFEGMQYRRDIGHRALSR